MGSDEVLVKQLLDTGKWSGLQARVGMRAGFRCEYCGLDLLASVGSYKLWQLEHIIPSRLKKERGEDPQDPENLAISCKACNVDFKRGFDPSRHVGPNPTRMDLIQAVKAHIAPRRERCELELAHLRRILGRFREIAPD